VVTVVVVVAMGPGWVALLDVAGAVTVVVAVDMAVDATVVVAVAVEVTVLVVVAAGAVKVVVVVEVTVVVETEVIVVVVVVVTTAKPIASTNGVVEVKPICVEPDSCPEVADIDNILVKFASVK
jgi:hypothetical protein